MATESEGLAGRPELPSADAGPVARARPNALLSSFRMIAGVTTAAVPLSFAWHLGSEIARDGWYYTGGDPRGPVTVIGLITLVFWMICTVYTGIHAALRS